MVVLQSHIVPHAVANIRLSDYAVGIFPQIPSKKGLKKAIKQGAIYINGQKAATGTWVKTGQKIDLVFVDKKPPKIYQLNLPIVFEDTHFAIIVKPAGIVVSGNQFRTIQNALLHNLTPSNQTDALQLPRPVHRLDHATSGLLLIAKTATAIRQLSQQFEQKMIQKRYQAIVIGKPITLKGKIEKAIDGKIALTQYEVLQTVPSLKTNFLSLLNLYPLTGRTHQLRIHLANLGHPILGDKLYHGEQPLLQGKGLFLCAVELSFLHPIHKKDMRFCIESPPKFNYRLAQEERRWTIRNS